jgi:hypothetical protein
MDDAPLVVEPRRSGLYAPCAGDVPTPIAAISAPRLSGIDRFATVLRSGVERLYSLGRIEDPLVAAQRVLFGRGFRAAGEAFRRTPFVAGVACTVFPAGAVRAAAFVRAGRAFRSGGFALSPSSATTPLANAASRAGSALR